MYKNELEFSASSRPPPFVRPRDADESVVWLKLCRTNSSAAVAGLDWNNVSIISDVSNVSIIISDVDSIINAASGQRRCR